MSNDTQDRHITPSSKLEAQEIGTPLSADDLERLSLRCDRVLDRVPSQHPPSDEFTALYPFVSRLLVGNQIQPA